MNNTAKYNNTIAGIAKAGRRGSYMVLCYARMRIRMPEGEWFTRSDYYEFQVGKIPRQNIKEYTLRLAESGFLERHKDGILWRITEKGIHAIHALDKQFALLNPHGNSDSKGANNERHRRLKKEEEQLLSKLASKAPVSEK